MLKPIYKISGAQRSTREVEIQARQHPRSADLYWMSARVGVRLPRATRSEHHPPIPDSQAETGCAREGDESGRRVEGLGFVTHPPSAPPSDAAPPLLSLPAPFCSPTANSQHVHSHLARSRRSPSLFTQGPLLP